MNRIIEEIPEYGTWYPISVAVQLYGKSKQYLYRLIKNNKIEHIKIKKNSVMLINIEDLEKIWGEKWIKKN